MQLVQVGALASTLVVWTTSVFGYEFSTSMRTTIPPIFGREQNNTNTTGLSINQESRIYGGSEADVDQYPFITSLRFNPRGKTFCGGTLVAPQYILTAGHCIKTDQGQIYASLGSDFGSGAGSGMAELIKVVEGYRHPLYDNAKHLYDVGLLKLKTPSIQKPAPLCAPDGSDNKVGTVATVLGWGVTEERKGSFTLQEVNVAIISNAECNKEYRNRITEGMVCAGNGNGKDSCNGDSGGPLLANDALVGLVSWGGRCGAKAGVYTRLAYVMDYINDVLDGAKDSGTSTLTDSVKQEESTLSPGNKPRKVSMKSTDPDTFAGEASFSTNVGASTTSSSSGGLVEESTTMAYRPADVHTKAPIHISSSVTDTKTGAATNEVPVSGKNCKRRLRDAV